METFNYKHQMGAVGDVTHRTLNARFGDGYAQRAGDGINTRIESWPLTFIGTPEKMQEIKDFLDRHAGYKSFLWKPPAGVQKPFVAPNGYQYRKAGANLVSVSTTFIQSNKI